MILDWYISFRRGRNWERLAVMDKKDKHMFVPAEMIRAQGHWQIFGTVWMNWIKCLIKQGMRRL